MEDLSAGFSVAIRMFLDCEDSIPHLNRGSRAHYADAYDFVRQSFALPRTLLDSLYSSERVRHFSTDDDITNLVLDGSGRRWH